MPYNDVHADVFSNPPELRNFEALPPQVIQRRNVINNAVSYITNLEAMYFDSVSQSASEQNPIIEQINANNSVFNINNIRRNLENAYGEAA